MNDELEEGSFNPTQSMAISLKRIADVLGLALIILASDDDDSDAADHPGIRR